MALTGWKENPDLGQEPCTTNREAWSCPNLKENAGDPCGELFTCTRENCHQHAILEYDGVR